MRTFVKHALWGTLIAGGITLLGVSAANAADTTSGDDAIGSGTQVVAPVSIPVTVTGDAISALGLSTSTGSAPAAPASAPAPAATTSGDDGIASGS